MSTTKETADLIGHLLHDVFPGWVRTMVSVLRPMGQITGHRDKRSALPRYHIPLLTNANCWVFHDGDWSKLLCGRVYVMDPTKVHGAVNWGTTDRLHLLVDR